MVPRVVMVVEDDEDVRETLRLVLVMEGYEVVTAQHGAEALERLAAMAPPTLILLDLMMPVMNGWEFAARIAEIDAWAGIPIILVTAYAEDARRIAQARRIVPKPIDLGEILGAVRELSG